VQIQVFHENLLYLHYTMLQIIITTDNQTILLQKKLNAIMTVFCNNNSMVLHDWQNNSFLCVWSLCICSNQYIAKFEHVQMKRTSTPMQWKFNLSKPNMSYTPLILF